MTSVPRILPRAFYDRPVLEVARDLLGQVLVHEFNGQVLRTCILETEAYDGEDDQACHARRGKTPRVVPMYEEAGHAFIYFTYGMHWLLNAVTGAVGYPAAVLIRAAYPLQGLTQMAQNRAGQPFAHWCDGPAKLTRALAIDGSLNTCDLCQANSPLRIETGWELPQEWVRRSPRIGIDYAGEPWRSLPWRLDIPYARFTDWMAHTEQQGVS
ncbi:MAG: DNA-3-methyladenine glycosylase [Anaerolineae bacterium]|nr:DNA-3-methyladenine glycosylase [Anaerolineae bacterium]